MIKQIVSASVGVAVWAAIAAEGVHPRPELLASVEFASFSAFQQKVVGLGATINNPVVSMMAVPAVQNALTEKFGKFRENETILLLCYADMAELRKALAADIGGADDALDAVLLYPCAEGPKEFIDSHPEAKKNPDGSIELEDGIVAQYSADGRFCAFASNAAMAKQALASASTSKAAAHPLVRLDVTETGLGLIGDLHQKLIEEQAKEKPSEPQAGKDQTAAIVAAFLKFQQTMSQRQNAKIRSFARLTMSLDLDETGLVFKGEAAVKPGAPVSPAVGFKLPAGALDAVPAGAPLFLAANTWLSGSIQSEQDYRAVVDDACGMLDAIATCAQSETNCAAIAKELCTAGSDLLKSAPVPAPTDWGVLAFAFGPQQEPYLIGNSTCAQAPQALEMSSRFCAKVAAAVEKSWPGILRAKGAGLTVNWFRLVDVIEEATNPKGNDHKDAEAVKKGFAAIVGGPESEMFSELTPQGTCRFFAGVKGFTPPAAAPWGEKRFAAALPEAAAARPSSAFYLSLYSLLRDNLLPIVVKAAQQNKQKQEEFQSILAVLPPAGANGAFAGASWEEKNGARWLFRLTKDEIRSIGMAANAVMAAQAQSAK